MLPPPAGGWRGRDWRNWTSGALLLLGASGRPSVSVNFSLSTCLRNDLLRSSLNPRIRAARSIESNGGTSRQGALKARRLRPLVRGSPTPHPPVSSRAPLLGVRQEAPRYRRL